MVPALIVILPENTCTFWLEAVEPVILLMLPPAIIKVPLLIIPFVLAIIDPEFKRNVPAVAIAAYCVEVKVCPLTVMVPPEVNSNTLTDELIVPLPERVILADALADVIAAVLVIVFPFIFNVIVLLIATVEESDTLAKTVITPPAVAAAPETAPACAVAKLL